MPKLKLGIIFGGRSEEHPISLKSAREVARHLDAEKYEPYWIGITRRGEWKLCDRPDVDLESDSLPAVALSPSPRTSGLLVIQGGDVETIALDVVFPVLHGRWGEDGAIRGLGSNGTGLSAKRRVSVA